MLVSGAQQSDVCVCVCVCVCVSVYIYIRLHVLFYYGLPQDIEYSSLCYIVGPCYLSVLYIVVCIC